MGASATVLCLGNSGVRPWARVMRLCGRLCAGARTGVLPFVCLCEIAGAFALMYKYWCFIVQALALACVCASTGRGWEGRRASVLAA